MSTFTKFIFSTISDRFIPTALETRRQMLPENATDKDHRRAEYAAGHSAGCHSIIDEHTEALATALGIDTKIAQWAIIRATNMVNAAATEEILTSEDGDYIRTLPADEQRETIANYVEMSINSGMMAQFLETFDADAVVGDLEFAPQDVYYVCGVEHEGTPQAKEAEAAFKAAFKEWAAKQA